MTLSRDRGTPTKLRASVPARVAEWPVMPVDVAPLPEAPRPGDWVWFIPDRPRHTSFHQVRAVEVLTDNDEDPVELVLVTCGRAWPVDEFAAAVPDDHPVLRQSADGTNAQCPNCANDRRGGSNYWARRLREVRRRTSTTAMPPRW